MPQCAVLQVTVYECVAVWGIDPMAKGRHGCVTRVTSGHPLSCTGMAATVADCGTIGTMITPFGTELRQRRGRMSRSKLARLSGVSESQIGNLETQGATPTRWTVIALAGSIPGWEVDDALRLVDEPPLTAGERAELAALTSPREQLDRLLDDLPASQVYGLLVLVRSVVNPQALPQVDGDTKDNFERRATQLQDVTPGSGDVLGAQRQIRRRPQGSDT